MMKNEFLAIVRRFDLTTESSDLLAFLSEQYPALRDQMTEAEAGWVSDRASTASMTMALHGDSQGSVSPVTASHHRVVAG
jgi:hypothetical protein